MSVDFIKRKVGSEHLEEAKRQQKQLSYLINSEVQEDITEEYLEQWAKRKYRSDDDFLNWIKTIFRTENFLSFYKYLRQPVASSKLVNDIIKPQLARVFFAEDSYFKYTIKGKEVIDPEELGCEDFNQWMFNALLFRSNDIVIVDLEDVNKPYREIVSIEDVVAIRSDKSVIKEIAYTGHVETESGEKIDGYAYMNDEVFAFYSKDYVLMKSVSHDLGICPADYISNEAFGCHDIVRKSVFSFVREEMEEYVFLKTLQRMCEPSMVIPIVTKLQTREKSPQSDDKKTSINQEPLISNEISGQKSSEFGSEVQGSKSVLQAGTIISVPMLKRDDGSLDMEAVKSFINFFHAPVEPFRYLNERIEAIKDSILKSILGDMSDQTNDRKNELQVKGGFVSAEDRLRNISAQLSRVRKRTDFKMLALKYGPDSVSNDAFYGSDFFLESQDALYNLFKDSPNPIERKNILLRLSKNRNRFNKDRSKREVLQYELMPYTSDVDFDKAIEKGVVDSVTFELQTRFTYWISVFEAKYGDIVYFWDETVGTNSEKLKLITSLLSMIITEESNKKGLSESEKTIKLLNTMKPEIATAVLEEFESEEKRALAGKTGNKKVKPAEMPLNK